MTFTHHFFKARIQSSKNLTTFSQINSSKASTTLFLFKNVWKNWQLERYQEDRLNILIQTLHFVEPSSRGEESWITVKENWFISIHLSWNTSRCSGGLGNSYSSYLCPLLLLLPKRIQLLSHLTIRFKNCSLSSQKTNIKQSVGRFLLWFQLS